MKQKYILFALVFVFSLNGIAQNPQTNYTVTSIPFQPYTGSMPALFSIDDINSPIITLPFSIDFYGTIFNQIVISTNGYIDFRSNTAGQNSPWQINQVTIPNTLFPVKMAVLGCFHDMNNSDGQGTITYGSYGIVPYRKFVVYYNNNSHFQCNASAKSSFQIILHETSNIIDVQLIDKQVCASWNGGRAVTGLINFDGTQAVTPPGRNVGSWVALQEGWRFSRAGYYTSYSYVVCDDDNDGFASFDLSVAANDLQPSNPTDVVFYETMLDAEIQANPLPSTYLNINPFQQTLYARYLNGIIMPVVLSVIDCTVDADNDTVPTALEDPNNDTNLANDDTDADGIPNYLDNDDDGDLILTNLEYVFPRANSESTLSLGDTDNDNIPNYLDNDDDGDGVLTWREDYNADGNPANDDTNNNGIADYLETNVALGVRDASFDNLISLYPNPVRSVLTIENATSQEIDTVSIYSINGSLVKQVNKSQNLETISVSDLASGVYFVTIQFNDKVVTKKFVKN
jgi:hypothetical protein